MATNPRVAKAFQAMKNLGISKDKVKPVLKKLLRLYEKNWALIEEENYRALVDAIFDEDDAKLSGEKQDVIDDNLEEISVHKEPERPLKRLCLDLRNQEENVDLPVNNGKTNSSALPLEVSTEEVVEMPGPCTMTLQPLADKRMSQPRPISSKGNGTNSSKRSVISDSQKPQMGHSYKGKEPMLPEVSAKQNVPGLDLEYCALQVGYMETDSEKPFSTKHKVPDNHASIKPVYDIFADNKPLNDAREMEAPLVMVGPVESPAQKDSIRKTDGQKTPASKSVAGGNGKENSSNGERNYSELVTSSEGSQGSLDIATSSSGEVKLSIKCNSICGRPSLHMPSHDKILKSMQDKCLRLYKFLDPNFSVTSLLKDMCECFLELATGSARESQEGLMNTVATLDLSIDGLGVKDFIHGSSSNGPAQIPRVPEPANGSVSSNLGPKIETETDARALVVVPRSRLSSKELRALLNSHDIAKGEENIEIPWTNEINDELPPSFNYIPNNLVFQNACAKFTLSQIKAESCCPNCVADCLSLLSPCSCSGETDHGFAYTWEGLVEDEFLEDCISMICDPQQQSLSYCAVCPLERAKNNEIMEPCKGHLQRKFIKECWSKCGCHMQCGNRVVQRGIQCKLQVFFTHEGKRWGLRTLEKLPKGAFVCEYVGEILTVKEWCQRKARRRRSNNNEIRMHPVVLDAFWGLKGDLKDDEALCLDATFYGNIARFINHRCLDANLIEIPVKMETPGHHYYHLAFFTTREVDALEELTRDDGIDFDGNDHPTQVFPCQCGSEFCRSMKRLKRKLRVSNISWH